MKAEAVVMRVSEDGTKAGYVRITDQEIIDKGVSTSISELSGGFPWATKKN